MINRKDSNDSDKTLFKTIEFVFVTAMFFGFPIAWATSLIRPDKIFSGDLKNQCIQEYLQKHKIELVGKSQSYWSVPYSNSNDSCYLKIYYFDCNEDGKSDVWVKVDVNDSNAVNRDKARKIGMKKSQKEWEQDIYDDIIDMNWNSKRQRNVLYREIMKKQR